MQGIDDIISTTYMIGKAIAAITFPGMYRIYDFHSPKAPRLKNSMRTFSFFAPDSDEEDEEEVDEPPPSQYAHFFHIRVGEDVIYIEDVLSVNEAGWYPLHSCCMSFMTKDAGIQIIDEIVRIGGSVDEKTYSGPGSFNREWTALHM